MEKPSKAGLRDETERIKGSQSWSEGSSEGKYSGKEGGRSRWNRPNESSGGRVASKSLKIDGVLCSGMDRPSRRAEALEDGQRLERVPCGRLSLKLHG